MHEMSELLLLTELANQLITPEATCFGSPETAQSGLKRRQTMARTILAAVCLGLLSLAGCSERNPHSHSGALICKYSPGKAGDICRAPRTATYVLYHCPAPSDLPLEFGDHQESMQIALRDLDRRQRIGFIRGGDGNLYAVAGPEKIQLHMGHYCWHIQPGSD
jgi:hypothetical protein